MRDRVPPPRFSRSPRGLENLDLWGHISRDIKLVAGSQRDRSAVVYRHAESLALHHEQQDWSGFVPSEPRVCGAAMDNSCRVRVAGLRNIKVRPLGVTKRHIWVCEHVCECEIAHEYKSGDNLALLGPSLMFHAFCARFATHTNSDRATHEIRCASGSVCNGSVGNVTSTLGKKCCPRPHDHRQRGRHGDCACGGCGAGGSSTDGRRAGTRHWLTLAPPTAWLW